MKSLKQNIILFNDLFEIISDACLLVLSIAIICGVIAKAPIQESVLYSTLMLTGMRSFYQEKITECTANNVATRMIFEFTRGLLVLLPSIAIISTRQPLPIACLAIQWLLYFTVKPFWIVLTIVAIGFRFMA